MSGTVILAGTLGLTPWVRVVWQVGCVDVLLLRWDGPADDALVAAWSEMGALQAAGSATLLGLRCDDVLVAKAAFDHRARPRAPSPRNKERSLLQRCLARRG
jgi:hypothetical protein